MGFIVGSYRGFFEYWKNKQSAIIQFFYYRTIINTITFFHPPLWLVQSGHSPQKGEITHSGINDLQNWNIIFEKNK